MITLQTDGFECSLAVRVRRWTIVDNMIQERKYRTNIITKHTAGIQNVDPSGRLQNFGSLCLTNMFIDKPVVLQSFFHLGRHMKKKGIENLFQIKLVSERVWRKNFSLFPIVPFKTVHFHLRSSANIFPLLAIFPFQFLFFISSSIIICV